MPRYGRTVTSVTVADGQTTTPAVAVEGMKVLGVYIPTGLDGTTIGFTACDTLAGTYLSVQDSGGAISYTVAASRYLALDPAKFLGIAYLKIVLGSQTGAIVLKLVTMPIGGGL